MQLFCPACQAAFPGASRCPKCGGLLLMPHEVSPDAPHRDTEAPPPTSTTLVGRIVLGTILSLGVYLALHTLMTGVVAAVDSDPAGWWLSARGLLALHGAQAVAVVFGSLVAGAGRAKGHTPGLVVGFLCGGAFLGFEIVAGASARDLLLYLQPPMLALFGLIAGGAGTWLWQPAPDLDYPLSPISKLSSIQLVEDAVAKPEPPTRWLRVILGAFVMIVGVMVADNVRKAAQKNSGGLLRVQSLGQGEFITWQMGMFAVLLGGVIAGAASEAGLRHGILAGGVAGISLYGVCAKAGMALPPIQWWLARMSMEDLPLDSPGVIGTIIGSIFLIGSLGGVLGGLVFPKLAPARMLRVRPQD